MRAAPRQWVSGRLRVAATPLAPAAPWAPAAPCSVARPRVVATSWASVAPSAPGRHMLRRRFGDDTCFSDAMGSDGRIGCGDPMGSGDPSYDGDPPATPWGALRRMPMGVRREPDFADRRPSRERSRAAGVRVTPPQRCARHQITLREFPARHTRRSVALPGLERSWCEFMSVHPWCLAHLAL